MKLYSRNQLIFGVVLTAAITAGALLLGGVVAGLRDKAGSNPLEPVTIEVDPAPASNRIIPARDNGEYSTDEQVNIRIYRLRQGQPYVKPAAGVSPGNQPLLALPAKLLLKSFQQCVPLGTVAVPQPKHMLIDAATDQHSINQMLKQV